MNFEEVVIWLGMGLLAALVLFSVVGAVEQSRLERFCLSHGYARADWRVFGESYCITRTDQTDIVVPQSKVK